MYMLTHVLRADDNNGFEPASCQPVMYELQHLRSVQQGEHMKPGVQ